MNLVRFSMRSLMERILHMQANTLLERVIRQGEKDTQSGTENGEGHRNDRRNRYGDLFKNLLTCKSMMLVSLRFVIIQFVLRVITSK